MRVFLSLVCVTSLVFGTAFLSESCGQTPTEGAARTAPSIVNVYDESKNMADCPWQPSGWMPDGRGISFQDDAQDNPHSGTTCIQIGYQPEVAWAGIYWLVTGSSGTEWGGVPGPSLFELLGIEKGDPVRLVWWARGENGGERVEFKVGGMTSGEFKDSLRFPLTSTYVELDDSWTRYTIDLTNKDLNHMASGFCWVTSHAQNRGRDEVWFYLDDIRFETFDPDQD